MAAKPCFQYSNQNPNIDKIFKALQNDLYDNKGKLLERKRNAASDFPKGKIDGEKPKSYIEPKLIAAVQISLCDNESPDQPKLQLVPRSVDTYIK